MSILEKLTADVRVAMKAREADKVSALRFVQAAVKKEEIDIRPKELTDEGVLTVLKKLAKQRKDASAQFRDAGRTDLADKEDFELKLLEAYLPAMMGEDQVKKIVGEVVAELGATSMKEMGAVMKEVQVRTAGGADNKLVSQLIKQSLS